MKTKTAQETKYDTVLLVDDSEIDNIINEKLIISAYFARKVVTKSGGQAGLDYLKKAVEGEAPYPEIIFLDLMMPQVDGFDFLEQYEEMLKKDPKLKESKIVVLSSSISPEDIDKASTNPFVQKFVNKPLSPKYLGAINL